MTAPVSEVCEVSAQGRGHLGHRVINVDLSARWCRSHGVAGVVSPDVVVEEGAGQVVASLTLAQTET